MIYDVHIKFMSILIIFAYFAWPIKVSAQNSKIWRLKGISILGVIWQCTCFRGSTNIALSGRWCLVLVVRGTDNIEEQYWCTWLTSTCFEIFFYIPIVSVPHNTSSNWYCQNITSNQSCAVKIICQWYVCHMVRRAKNGWWMS